MTPLQRWRAKRDAVIRSVSASGFSQRLLADVFDMTRGGVQFVIKAGREQNRPKPDTPGDYPPDVVATR